jgi:hypothetical protein
VQNERIGSRFTVSRANKFKFWPGAMCNHDHRPKFAPASQRGCVAYQDPCSLSPDKCHDSQAAMAYIVRNHSRLAIPKPRQFLSFKDFSECDHHSGLWRTMCLSHKGPMSGRSNLSHLHRWSSTGYDHGNRCHCRSMFIPYGPARQSPCRTGPRPFPELLCITLQLFSQSS